MRSFVYFLVFSYVFCFALFLSANVPENPRSLKDKIGAHIDFPHLSTASPLVDEAICLIAVLVIPTLMAMSMITAADANQKLRAQIMRMDAAEKTASSVIGNSHAALFGVKVGIRELSGDALEQRLMGIERDHGDVKCSLEQIERDHAERMHRMQDRAQITTLQITETYERVTTMYQGDVAMAHAITAVEEIRRNLDEKLSENEGDDNLAERLTEAEKGMDDYTPRIEALEGLKPKVIATRDRFAEVVARLKAVNDDGNGKELQEIVKKLTEDVGSFDEDELTPAETDQNNNPLESVWQDIPDVDDFNERIDALAALTKKVLAEKAEFEEIKKRLEAADGDDNYHLRDLVAGLATDVEAFEEELSKLEVDENSTDLDDAFSEIDDVSDFEDRIKVLEDLAPKIGPLRTTLTGLKSSVSQLENLSLAKEIEKLDSLREKIEGMLDDLENEVSRDALDELVSAEADFKSRIDALKASVADA